MSNNIIELKDVFHGTEKQRGIKIIDNKKMEESIGDKHWLGNGAYFYEQLFLSYKWIRDMFKDRQRQEHNTYEDLIDKYIILHCNIKVDKSRIFDIDGNYEHKFIFDRFIKNINEDKNHSKRLSKQIIADGVVLNIMFSEYKYIDKYDVVIASFEKKRSEYHNNDKTRLNYVLEKQICVKNLSKVYDINNKDFKDDYDNLTDLMKEYNDRKNQIAVYSSKRKGNSRRHLL